MIPGYGLGPTINGSATDIITILTADNNFVEVGLTAVTSTTVDVVASVEHRQPEWIESFQGS